LCAEGAPEAAVLLSLGLVEGSPNTHPGQGTACRRFFFANAYLELVFVVDEAEARAEPARATRLFERWSRRRKGASPFGIVLRPADRAADTAADLPLGGRRPADASTAVGGGHPADASTAGDDATAGSAPPFPTWSYRPPYLPPGFSIEVATGTPLDEPEIFYIPFARRPDRVGREPIAHGIPAAEITAVGIGLPGLGARSAAARAVEERGAVTFAPADDHLMTLTFDGGARNGLADLHPDLPLVLRW
jgi:glyoxalase-like protein